MKKFIAFLFLCSTLSAQVTDDSWITPILVLPPQGASRGLIAERQRDTNLSEIIFRTAVARDWHSFELDQLHLNSPNVQIRAYTIVNWDWKEETATWQNRQGTTTGPVSCRMTFYGDADLDGDVDTADNNILAQHWQQPGNWTDGDFNGDGVVNVADLNLLALNIGKNVSVNFAEVLYVPKAGDNIAIRCVSNGSVRIKSKEF